MTNKDIILALILRLETEHDEAVQNIYRNALEMVVLSTQNDTQS
ncbi:biofilm development regulator YmgB/AriR family protein [Pantoea rodasii]